MSRRGTGRKQRKSKQTPKPNVPPDHRLRWWSRLWHALLGLAALAGVGIAIYTTFGPPWPVEPEISPFDYSSTSPLTIPFKIENTSSVAAVFIKKVTCVVIDIKSRSSFKISNIAHVATYESERIGPMATRPYSCRAVHAEGIDIQSVEMKITIDYVRSFIFEGKPRSSDQLLTWINGRWVKGAIL